MGSKSKSTQTQNPSTVWSPQQPYLQDLYQQAQNQFNNSAGATQQSQNYLDQFASQLSQAGSLYGQASQGINQGYQGLQGAGNALQEAFNNIGQGYGNLNTAAGNFQNIYNTATGGVNPQLDMYRRQISQQFNEDILPGIRGQAAVSGQLGSSRAGIGTALAGARSNQQLQDLSAQLYTTDQNRALAAMQGLSQNALGYGQLGSQQSQVGSAMNQNALGYGQLAGQQASIGGQYASLGNQYGGLSQMQAALPWYALQQYQGLLGSPTVLGGGGSGSQSSMNLTNPFSFKLS